MKNKIGSRKLKEWNQNITKSPKWSNRVDAKNRRCEMTTADDEFRGDENPLKIQT